MITPPFRSFLDKPESAGEVLGDVRKAILSVNSEYVPESAWRAYANLVERFFGAKSANERMNAFIEFRNNREVIDDISEQEVPEDLIQSMVESHLQDYGFYVERNKDDEDYQDYLDAIEKVREKAYDDAETLYYDEELYPLFKMFGQNISEKDISEKDMGRFEFDKKYDPRDFNIMPLFLSIKDPITYSFHKGYRDKSFSDLLSLATESGNDGAIFNDVKDGGGYDDIYVAFHPTQIKSATANVGTFGIDEPSILYQMIKDDAKANAKKQAAVGAAYRRARIKLRSSKNVNAWRNAMISAVDRVIKINYSGAKPFDYAKAADILASDMEEKQKEKIIKRMKALDKKYHEAIERETGYQSIEQAPTVQLIAILEEMNPVAYGSFLEDGTLTAIRDIIPRLDAEQEYGNVYTDVFLQNLVDAAFLGSAKREVVSSFVKSILPRDKVLVKLFGKAGIELVMLSYEGKTMHSRINNDIEPMLTKIYQALHSVKNQAGHRYDTQTAARIGETIFTVENNVKIDAKDKLSTILSILSDDELIAKEDVVSAYEAAKEIVKYYSEEIAAFNAKYKTHIGNQENYLPRQYIGEEIIGKTSPASGYLYPPTATKGREKEGIEASRMNTNLYSVMREYSYKMSKYLSFYGLADYVQERKTTTSSGSTITHKSKMYLNTTYALAGNIASHSKYIEEYVKDAIGYKQQKGSMARGMTKLKNAAYVSLLSASAKLTMLNFTQKWLIFAAVGYEAAAAASKDVKFLSGDLNNERPLLGSIMSAYKVHNQSHLQESMADIKRDASDDRLVFYRSEDYVNTVNVKDPKKIKEAIREKNRAMLKHNISEAYYVNAQILAKSPFQYAEKGNRGYAHLAGVYEIAMASPQYKNAIASGMSRADAIEVALADPNIYRAAKTHGAVINARVNADADTAFSPSVYSGALKEFMSFIRYGHTFMNLMHETLLPKSMKNSWSKDLYRLAFSGQKGYVSQSEVIRAAQVMKAWTSRQRIETMLNGGAITIAPTRGKLTARQVDSINSAVTKLLDDYIEGAKQVKSLVRGNNPRAMLALGGFMLSDAIMQFLYAYLRMLAIERVNPDETPRARTLLDTILDSLQVMRFMFGVDLGAGMLPNQRGMYTTPEGAIKSLAEWSVRVSPLGAINTASREYYGKYLTDYLVDYFLD